MIRLSVSDLESYRYWKDDEDATVDDLLRRLAHAEPPTDQMRAGRALAKLFEHAPVGEDLDQAQVDGWTFTFGIDAQMDIPPVRELKAEEVFHTPSGAVTLVGMVDGLQGFRVHDQKLTEKWDPERYLDSLQWRAYLLMFGAFEFVYDVFVGRYNGRHVQIADYHRVSFYGYPGMRAHVDRAVCELAEVVAKYLPARAA